MNPYHIIMLVVIITISSSIQNVLADNSDTSWKITIKKDPSKINGTSYWPPELQARVGDTITWINKDVTSHTVTSGVINHLNYTGKIFDSGIINPGSAYSFKIPPDRWSAYYYFCKIHPWMTGKIDIGDAYLHQSPISIINTDKESYHNNEMLKIFGHVNDTYQIMPITIQIFDSQRNLIFLNQADLLKDHSFSYSIITSNSIFKSPGNYKIKALYGFPSTVVDTNFSVQGDSMPERVIPYYIPFWMKNNAGLWADDQITDTDFIKSMEHMIKTEHIIIPSTYIMKTGTNTIPAWVKKDAGLWAKNTISDKEFMSDIQYLVSQRILMI